MLLRNRLTDYHITKTSFSMGQALSRQLQFEVTNSKMYAYYRIIMMGKPSDFIYLAPFLKNKRTLRLREHKWYIFKVTNLISDRLMTRIQAFQQHRLYSLCALNGITCLFYCCSTTKGPIRSLLTLNGPPAIVIQKEYFQKLSISILTVLFEILTVKFFNIFSIYRD